MNTTLANNYHDGSIFRQNNYTGNNRAHLANTTLQNLIGTSLPIKSNHDLDVVFDLIVSLALDKPSYVGVLSECCYDLIDNSNILQKLPRDDRISNLMSHCKKSFDYCLAHDQRLSNIQNCTNKEHKEILVADYHKNHARYRGKLVGIVRLIDELNNKYLNIDFLIEYLQNMIEFKGETALRCLCVFLANNIDGHFYNKEHEKLIVIFRDLEIISENEIISKSLYEMISMVLKRKKNNSVQISFNYNDMLKETSFEIYKITRILTDEVPSENINSINMKCFGVLLVEEDVKLENIFYMVHHLTLENIQALVDQFKSFPLFALHRLHDVIDLIFEKAVDESNSSVEYAVLCKSLAFMQLPLDPNTEEMVFFKKLVIQRCQKEFEKSYTEQPLHIERLREINACNNSEKDKLLFNLYCENRKIWMRCAGNIRFIGELFKQNIVALEIVMPCLQRLIEYKGEERLEWFCILLKTIGNELENRGADLNPILNQIKDIMDNKTKYEISSRIRSMLHVIQCQIMNSKTNQQVEKEADIQASGPNDLSTSRESLRSVRVSPIDVSFLQESMEEQYNSFQSENISKETDTSINATLAEIIQLKEMNQQKDEVIKSLTDLNQQKDVYIKSLEERIKKNMKSSHYSRKLAKGSK